MALDALALESFVEYAIGTTLLIVRLFARLWTVGFGGLWWDDLLTLLAIGFYTVITVVIYLIGQLNSNIGLNEQTALEVPEKAKPDMILGSKLASFNWLWYISYIWALKGILLILYSRISTGLRQHMKIVKAVSIFTVCTWVACILTHLCQCVPATRMWQIAPYPGDECTVRPINYWVIGFLNVITDIFILIIPFPILFKLQVPLYRKIMLGFLFSSGAFVMIATILRAYYSLKSIETLIVALGWASRELFVAAVTVALPGIRPLFSKSRWSGSGDKNRSQSNTAGGTFPLSNIISRTRKNDTQMSTSGTFVEHKGMDYSWRKNARRLSSDASDDLIIQPDDDLPPGSHHGNKGITVTTEYSVAHEEAATRNSTMGFRH